MKQGEEDFEIVKNKQSKKRNYIFQKDRLTRSAFYFILIVLLILVVAVVVTSLNLGQP